MIETLELDILLTDLIIEVVNNIETGKVQSKDIIALKEKYRVLILEKIK